MDYNNITFNQQTDEIITPRIEYLVHKVDGTVQEVSSIWEELRFPVITEFYPNSSNDTIRTYSLYNHLGSNRAVLNQNNELVGAQDYDPWGYLARSWDSTATRYKFTGKERDNESGYDYFGARYYNSRTAVWQSTDPLFEKHIQFTPYNYVLGNPMIMIDPDGRQIDVSSLSQNSLDQIISDLKTISGYTFYKDENNFLKINWTIPRITKGTSNTGAKIAEEIDAFNSEIIRVVEHGGYSIKSCYDPSNKGILLNPDEINSYIYGVQNGLNSLTMGWGMIFLHEALHSPLKNLDPDDNALEYGAIGSIESDYLNEIRKDLGKDWGILSSHQAKIHTFGVYKYGFIPFEEKVKHDLEKNNISSYKYIKSIFLGKYSGY